MSKPGFLYFRKPNECEMTRAEVRAIERDPGRLFLSYGDDTADSKQADNDGEQDLPHAVGSLALNFTGGRVHEDLISFATVLVGHQPDRQEQVFVRDGIVSAFDGVHDLCVATDPLMDVRKYRSVNSPSPFLETFIQFDVIGAGHQSSQHLLIEGYDFE